MNLHKMVRGAITSVNRDVQAFFLASTGSTTSASGVRAPAYAAAVPVNIQAQALRASDLRHLSSLNIQGVMRSVHMYGNAQGVVRPNQKGGDLLRFPQVPGAAVQDWLVVCVFETWPDWCRVAVCLQA